MSQHTDSIWLEQLIQCKSLWSFPMDLVYPDFADGSETFSIFAFFKPRKVNCKAYLFNSITQRNEFPKPPEKSR